MQFRVNLDAIGYTLYGIALPSLLEFGLCYFFGRVGGWVGGEMEIKAISASN